jgi:Tol biopolymer transport system component
MTLAPESRLGPYEILSPLGAGGMGEVYRAKDPRLGREVAIKVLPTSLSQDADRLRRFEQEAKAAGLLNHPNITAVYDIGTHDGAPYVVQELLEGESLRSVLAGGGLSWRRAVDCAIGIARGLAAAHEKGIVHRDLKPENLFVTKDGRIKILDFGLAKLTEPLGGGGQTNLPTATPGTEPGIVLGTLGYMSPEQVRGQPADHRSDIFSFGAILYEMLSGRRAFHGDSAADTMSAILREDPPDLSLTNQNISPALDRIVRHCLEKSPERRLHSAHDLAFELESLTQTSGSAAALPALRSGRLRAVLIATGVLAVAAAAFLVGRRGAPAASRRESNFRTYSRLTSMAGGEYAPALSPDGTALAFVKRTSGKPDIWVQRTGGQKPIDLTSDCDKESYSPAFSPDGNLIAYGSQCAGGGLFLMGATGENARRLTTFGGDPVWSPDGREIVFTTEVGWKPYGRAGTSEMWAVEVATGKTRRLFAGDAVQASVSPHRLRIAYWGLPFPGSQRDIWTIPYTGLASGEKPVAVTQDPALDWNPVWSPEGHFLYFLSNRDGAMNLWRVPVDEATGKTLGPPEPQTLPAREVSGLALARDGRHVAYVVDEPTFSIVRLAFDPATGGVRGQPAEILQTSQEVSNVTLSPDGQLLAFDSMGGRQEDLFLIRSDGSGLRKLTDDAPRDRFPSFSSDGRRIVFMSDRGGSWELWTIQPDGSGLTQLTRTGESPYTPFWSPEGTRIAASNGKDVFLFELDEKGGVAKTNRLPRPPDGLFGQAVGWTADGRRLILTFNRPDASFAGVAFFSLGTEKYDIVPPPSRLPVRQGRPLTPFLVPGNRLLLLNADGLYLSELASSRGRLLLPHPPTGPYFGLTVSRDSKALYLLRLQENADIWQATLP